MKQTSEDRAIIALLERLKQQWPWIEQIYVVRGSPAIPKQYQSIILDTRQSETLKNVTVESTLEKRIFENQIVVLVDTIQPRPENNYILSIWVIAQQPVRDGLERLFRKGNITVHFRGNQASVGSLAGLATRFEPFLLPPSDRRVGCSRLLDGGSNLQAGVYCWLNNRTLWVVTQDETRPAYYHELKIEGGKLHTVRSTLIKARESLYLHEWDIRFSPQAYHISWYERPKDNVVRVIQSLKSNQVVSRIEMPKEQTSFDHAWIDDTRWVEYRREDNNLILDIYDVKKAQKVHSYMYRDIYTDPNDRFYGVGINAQGELALVLHPIIAKNGSVKVVYASTNRQSIRTALLRVPPPYVNVEWLVMSPDGKWLAWHLPPDTKDWRFFTRGAIVVSREDGSDACLVAEFVDVQSGLTHSDGFRRFEWRRDSAALADNWGDCLYGFPLM